jgi:hypothetical protein
MEVTVRDEVAVFKNVLFYCFNMRVQRYFENWFWAMQIVINYQYTN